MRLSAILSKERLSRLLEPRMIVFILVISFVGVMALLPSFIVIWNSFKVLMPFDVSDFSLSNWTLYNFIEVYTDPQSFKMLINSFIFATGSAVVAMVFGGTLAFLVERTNTPFRNVIYGLMFIPMALPSMLKGIAWIMLLSPKIGLLNLLWCSFGFSQPLFSAYSLPAMCWVEGISMSAMAFLLLGASLRAMDPSLEEAAYTSGASKPYTMFRITLRLMTPALAGVSLLVFVRGLEAFDIPLVMGLSGGIHVFSTNIYWFIKELVPPDYSGGYTYSLILIAICGVGLILYQRVFARAGKYATITGKGYRPRIMDLGKWKPVAAAVVIFWVFIALILPLFVLIWASLVPYYQAPSMEALKTVSLDNYRVLFGEKDFALAVKNTLMLCTGASLSCMILATLISWLVIRWRTRATKVLDWLAFIPYALPGVSVAFGLLVLFLSFPNPIYGTIWIIMLGNITKFLPAATRFTHAGMAQIRGELEEAASASGANSFAVLRRIIVPLLIPSLVGGGLFVFLHVSKVLGTAAILGNADSRILATLILHYWERGGMPSTSALSVVMIVGLVTLTIATRKLAQRGAMVATT
ncbi:ABC transporter permease [Chloroflexota bacterium]